MEKNLLRQLVKTALITAPLMAIIYATPLYIFTAIPLANSILVFPLVTVPILIAWSLNIILLLSVKAKWVSTFIRTVVVCAFMFGISGFVVHLIKPFVLLSDSSILMVRIVNILSVNAIIYVLIDLTLTRKNKNKIELEYAQLRLVKLEAEYKLLKDQINPHFLFNALSTAKALIKQEPDLAEEYIVRLSDFLRLSINNTKKTVTLKEEIQMCIDFITLNRIRFGRAIDFVEDLTIDPTENYVPYFSLLSLVENAIKHNTFSIESPLIISLRTDENSVEILNTRKPKFTLENSSKTGLRNLNERYLLLAGKEITIVETEVTFSVKMPLLKN